MIQHVVAEREEVPEETKVCAALANLGKAKNR